MDRFLGLRHPAGPANASFRLVPKLRGLGKVGFGPRLIVYWFSLTLSFGEFELAS